MAVYTSSMFLGIYIPATMPLSNKPSFFSVTKEKAVRPVAMKNVILKLNNHQILQYTNRTTINYFVMFISCCSKS